MADAARLWAVDIRRITARAVRALVLGADVAVAADADDGSDGLLTDPADAGFDVAHVAVVAVGGAGARGIAAAARAS
jgi:hypothetical protein